MKRKLITPLTLILLGALLFTACASSSPSDADLSTSTTSTAATTTVSTTTDINVLVPEPGTIYRPDLIWLGSYSTDIDVIPNAYRQNGSDYIARKGVLDIRFLHGIINLSENFITDPITTSDGSPAYIADDIPETDKFVVRFRLCYSPEDDIDKEALKAYLIDQGLEFIDVGAEQNLDFYIATWQQLSQLDCNALYKAAGIDDPDYGIDVWLADPIPLEDVAES